MSRIVLSSFNEQPVVVTGATGALGTALLEQLNAPISQCSPDDIRTCNWDSILPSHAIVFHLAACVHQPRASWMHHLQVNASATLRLGTKCLARSCKLVHASTIAAATPERSPYAASKALAEEMLAGLACEGLDVTNLRFPLLYGRLGRGNMERLMRAVGYGNYIPVGSPSARKTCLHFRDAALALLFAARADYRGRTLGVPGTTHSLKEITSLAYASWGKKAPSFWIPTQLSRLSAALLDSVAPGSSAGRSLRSLLRSEEVVPGTPDVLPFEAAISLSDGLAEVARGLASTSP